MMCLTFGWDMVVPPVGSTDRVSSHESHISDRLMTYIIGEDDVQNGASQQVRHIRDTKRPFIGPTGTKSSLLH